MMQVFYIRFENQFNHETHYDDIMHQFRMVRKIHNTNYIIIVMMHKNIILGKKGLSSHYWLRAIGWLVAACCNLYEQLRI